MKFIEQDTLQELLSVKVSKYETEDEKNFFKITAMNEDGSTRVIEGYNAVLNSGRKFNSLKLVGADINNELVYDENGNVITPKTFLNTDIDCKNSVLFGFSALGATISGTTEPVPTAILPMNKFMQSENLDVNVNSKILFFPSTGVDALGDSYGSDDVGGKIKEFTKINSGAIDGNGIGYTDITLDIKREEFKDKFWNVIVIWALIEENGNKFYLPFSAFAFPPMSNGGGAFSYVINYGIYL